MQIYVVGFLFDKHRQFVALIRKKRPAWQAGLLNGIGGHVEPGEEVSHAMRREFFEETGVYVNTWRRFCILTCGREAIVHFFESVDLDPFYCTSPTDEQVDIIPVDEAVRCSIVPNLKWLIPLACETQTEVRADTV
jgi:8-oxo-dGTP pyrophosphatase MutT (NUDIX family)